MCARFSLVTGSQAFLDLFEIEFDASQELPEYHPTEEVPAVVSGDEVRAIDHFRWGLIPPWSKDLKKGPINARSETLDEKPTFREAFKKRRCLIPASSFYEWDGGDRYEVTVEDQPLFAIAGLYEVRPELKSCTMVTIPSSDVLWDINDRMPLLLQPTSFESWLDPTTPMEAVRESLLTSPPLLKLKLLSLNQKTAKHQIEQWQLNFAFDAK